MLPTQCLLTIVTFASTLSTAAPIWRRDPQSLANMQAAIFDIGNTTEALGTALSSFDGGLIDSFKTLGASSKSSDALDNAITTISNSQRLTPDESNEMAITLVGLTDPTIKTLKAARDAQPKFAEVLQDGIVGSQLQDTAKKQDDLIAAIKPKLSGGLGAAVDAGAQPITAAFKKTLAVYNGGGGAAGGGGDAGGGLLGGLTGGGDAGGGGLLGGLIGGLGSLFG